MNSDQVFAVLGGLFGGALVAAGAVGYEFGKHRGRKK